MDLALAIYDCTDLFPRYEQYGLTAQIRRAVVSIPSNIAEGQGRAQPGEFLNSLSVARGSLQELDIPVTLHAPRPAFNAQRFGVGLALPPSTTKRHSPPGCFFQIVRYLPNRWTTDPLAPRPVKTDSPIVRPRSPDSAASA